MHERNSADIHELAHIIWAAGKACVIQVLIFLLREYFKHAEGCACRPSEGLPLELHEAWQRHHAELQQAYEALKQENEALKKRLARYQHEPHPSQPSSTLRPDQREALDQKKKARQPTSTKSKRAGRPGGHPGVRRALPHHIDEERHHTLERCPHCKSPLGKPISVRHRIVEDIPPVKIRVIRHHIYRYACRGCRKTVEPELHDVLPRCQFGIHVATYTLWFHYGLHLSIRKVCALVKKLWQFDISPGGLYQMWARIGELIAKEYDRLIEEAQKSAHLHIDETGWRINGTQAWLWCFTRKDLALYVISPSRGSPVLEKVLGKVFQGIVISDFYAAYRWVSGVKQKCLVHLKRACQVSEYHGAESPEWSQFAHTLGRWIHLVFHLSRRRHLIPAHTFSARVRFMEDILDKMINYSAKDHNVRRLQKRLRTYRHELLTCLMYDDIPPDNNHAERILRPAVISRKVSFGNRSPKGAFFQSLFMSLFQTWHLRNLDPIDSMLHLISKYRSAQ